MRFVYCVYGGTRPRGIDDDLPPKYYRVTVDIGELIGAALVATGYDPKLITFSEWLRSSVEGAAIDQGADALRFHGVGLTFCDWLPPDIAIIHFKYGKHRTFVLDDQSLLRFPKEAP